MKGKTVIEYIKEKLDFMTYHNNIAPFPVFDTGYVEYTKNKLEEMSKEKEKYDNMPVAACKYCNSLHILNDEIENDICARCGAINDIVIYQDIETYLTSTNEE